MFKTAVSYFFPIISKVVLAVQLENTVRLLPGLTSSQVFKQNYRNYTHIMEKSAGKDSCQLAKKMSEWSFSPNSLLSLPLDQVEENYVRRYVKTAVFSKVVPTPLQKNLQLVGFSEDVLVNILDMDPSIASTDEFVQFISGDKILPSCIPLAHRYGGHQFGVWASQLGDGRAILLGEYTNKAGQRWELQLKGSGLTPYSRGADGRAVLRSSVREFLAAEAMHHLGVPTSRVAALITSDVGIVRDPLYNGQPILEKASVVLRVAPSWFRIGSLELPAKLGETATLRELVTYILKVSFPELWQQAKQNLPKACVLLGARVAALSYKMWVDWQRVGFVHGVMNSDNISLLGVTIDYGPFGFMSTFNSRYVPNSSDDEARYCYIQQISALQFDLEKLREALGYVIATDSNTSPEEKSTLVQEMAQTFRTLRKIADVDLETAFLKKIGLGKEDNYSVVKLLLLMMEESKADFTATFRQLSEVDLPRIEKLNSSQWALQELQKHSKFLSFVELYRKALDSEGIGEEERKRSMCSVNPCYILRNWMAQDSITQAENGNFELVRLIEKILQNPFSRQEDAENLGYGGKPPKWEKGLKVSCSS